MELHFTPLKNRRHYNIESVGISVSLITASPGIIAMILGTFLIVTTIKSKDQFPGFNKEIVTSTPPGRVNSK